MKKLLFTTIALLIFGAVQIQAGEEWSLARDKEGIKVYTRKYADYAYKEYKAITVMNGSVDQLVKIFKDPSTYEKWSYKCLPNSAEVLDKNESKGMYTIYMEIKAPLVANRDVVSVYKFNEKEADGSIHVEFWADPDYIPKKNGKVRVPEMIGYWKVTPQSDGKIKIVHQAFSHPGGSPPAGFVNSAAVDAPFTMLKKLRGLME